MKYHQFNKLRHSPNKMIQEASRGLSHIAPHNANAATGFAPLFFALLVALTMAMPARGDTAMELPDFDTAAGPAALAGPSLRALERVRGAAALNLEARCTPKGAAFSVTNRDPNFASMAEYVFLLAEKGHPITRHSLTVGPGRTVILDAPRGKRNVLLRVKATWDRTDIRYVGVDCG